MSEAMNETIERTIELEGRTIMYDVTGQGPPIVFVHGVWATGGVWYPVIDELAPKFRCINIHLPLGVHRYPSPPAVDHSPHALARVVAGLLDALDLRDVTLVGNDTGGAICQIVIAEHADRIGRLVLTNCDAFEVFPPRKLLPLYRARAQSRTMESILAARAARDFSQNVFQNRRAHESRSRTPEDADDALRYERRRSRRFAVDDLCDRCAGDDRRGKNLRRLRSRRLGHLGDRRSLFPRLARPPSRGRLSKIATRPRRGCDAVRIGR